jgi:hypothetical protein
VVRMNAGTGVWKFVGAVHRFKMFRHDKARGSLRRKNGTVPARPLALRQFGIGLRRLTEVSITKMYLGRSIRQSRQDKRCYPRYPNQGNSIVPVFDRQSSRYRPDEMRGIVSSTGGSFLLPRAGGCKGGLCAGSCCSRMDVKRLHRPCGHSCGRPPPNWVRKASFYREPAGWPLPAWLRCRRCGATARTVLHSLERTWHEASRRLSRASSETGPRLLGGLTGTLAEEQCHEVPYRQEGRG